MTLTLMHIGLHSEDAKESFRQRERQGHRSSPPVERGTSNKVRSLPPVIFHTIPVALSMPISSKGDCMAFNAASLALVFPTQKQTPNKFFSALHVHLMRVFQEISYMKLDE